MPTQIDNVKWVAENRISLGGDNAVLTDVVAYVRQYHPLRGCARRWFPELNGEEPIQELSKLADAVTVACVDTSELCTQMLHASVLTDQGNFEGWNQTSIGNLAFFIMNTRVGNINFARNCLDQWRIHFRTHHFIMMSTRRQFYVSLIIALRRLICVVGTFLCVFGSFDQTTWSTGRLLVLFVVVIYATMVAEDFYRKPHDTVRSLASLLVPAATSLHQ